MEKNNCVDGKTDSVSDLKDDTSNANDHFSIRWRNRLKYFCMEYILEDTNQDQNNIAVELEIFCSNKGLNTPETDDGEAIATVNTLSTSTGNKRMLHRRRRLLAFTLPALLYGLGWLAVMVSWDLWFVFPQKYYMSIAMVFAALICGITGIGGGVVAFPVMTLAFDATPAVARDFTLMIQTFGMSSATFAIVYMKIPCDVNVLMWCSLGGSVGLIGGLYAVDPFLTTSQKKMAFVSFLLAFAFALVLLNNNGRGTDRDRVTFERIPNITRTTTAVLFGAGLVGGVFTSFSGCGLDTCSFCIITLLYRLSEKTAIPTAIVLMTVNSTLGFFWRGLVQVDVGEDSWQFLMACLPFVTLFAPIGSLIGSRIRRLVLSYTICAVNVVAFISGVVIVRQSTSLIVMTVAMVVIGLVLFYCLIKAGNWILKKNSSSLTVVREV